MRSTLIVRRSARAFCSRRRAKINTKIKTQPIVTRGFMRPVFVVCACVIFVSILYLFTVNARAMQGQSMRSVENRIDELHKERERLRIERAELVSLYRIEQQKEGSAMTAIEEPFYIDEDGSLALR